MDIAHAIDLARRLSAANRPLLGFGDAAMVLSCGPDVALKIGFDGGDGWPAWARWCQAHPSPHVPLIHALQLIEHHGQVVAFVGVVERLWPTLAAARWMRGDKALKRDPWRIAELAEPTHPGVAAMLRAAATDFPGGAWDATPSNWMERESGEVVLTDPLMRAGPRPEIARTCAA